MNLIKKTQLIRIVRDSISKHYIILATFDCLWTEEVICNLYRNEGVSRITSECSVFQNNYFQYCLPYKYDRNDYLIGLKNEHYFFDNEDLVVDFGILISDEFINNDPGFVKLNLFLKQMSCEL